MDLLNESKRMWLLSYIFVSGIIGVLYYYQWNSSIGKAIGYILVTMQLIMLVEFLLIILFKWTCGCRIIASIMLLSLIIYEGVNDYLTKWYIIIPIFFIAEFYMLWNLGGIVNCIIANNYKKILNDFVSDSIGVYGQYSMDIDDYNLSNELGFWSKARKKKEPNWNRLSFKATGLEMFFLSDALFGVSTDLWDNNIRKLKNVNSKLNEKKDAINSNKSIREERDMLGRVISKGESVGVSNPELNSRVDDLETIRKNGIKKEKKILKRRL